MKFRLSLLLLAIAGTACLSAGQEFSQGEAFRVLRHLAVDIGPRTMGSPAEQEALSYAAEQFRLNGCDTAFVMPMDFTEQVNTSSGIAVGIRRGSNGRIIVIGGHIDSSSPEVPGADDDASGSAVVMECSRILGRMRTASTLVFCCFGGEEQGLRGSAYFVDHFPELDSVALMLQVDMANGTGVLDIDPDGRGGFSAPPWLVRAAVEEYDRLGYTNLRYPTHFFSINYGGKNGAGSDHESFLARGVPAIDFSSDVTSPIHTPCDNIGNYDPAGLKRSGDLVLRLVHRFDGGTPSRTPEKYWLWLAGAFVLTLPAPMIPFIPAGAILIALITFFRIRRGERGIDYGAPHRWSGLKIWFASLFPILAAWLSSDLISLVRNVRFPWVTGFFFYVLLGFATMLVCYPAGLVFLKRLQIARRPSPHFLRAMIALIFMIAALSLWNVKLTIEPAVALLLMSGAMLVPRGILKTALLLAAPIWPLRLIFSEWSELLVRSFSSNASASVSAWSGRTGFALFFFSVYFFPFLSAGVAGSLQSVGVKRLFLRLTSAPMRRFTIAVPIVICGFLSIVPVFSPRWLRSVDVRANYNWPARQRELFINSNEYLDGIVYRLNGITGRVNGNCTSYTFPATGAFDTSWVQCWRNDNVFDSGKTTRHDLTLRMHISLRPYAMTVRYSSTSEIGSSFRTPWKFTTEGRNSVTMAWYSFPDSNLVIPVHWEMRGNDTVHEEIQISFNRLPVTLELSREETSFIPRTVYTESHWYGGVASLASGRFRAGSVEERQQLGKIGRQF